MLGWSLKLLNYGESAKTQGVFAYITKWSHKDGIFFRQALYSELVFRNVALGRVLKLKNLKLFQRTRGQVRSSYDIFIRSFNIIPTRRPSDFTTQMNQRKLKNFEGVLFSRVRCWDFFPVHFIFSFQTRGRIELRRKIRGMATTLFSK